MSNPKEWALFGGIIAVGILGGVIGSFMLPRRLTSQRAPSFQMPDDPNQGNRASSSDGYQSVRSSTDDPNEGNRASSSDGYQSVRSSTDFQSVRGSVGGKKSKRKSMKKSRRK